MAQLAITTGPWAGLPGPVLGWFRPEVFRKRIKIRPQAAQAGGPGHLGPDVGLFAFGFGRASKSAFRPTEGRPEADFEALPIGVRPKFAPEARFPARKLA